MGLELTLGRVMNGPSKFCTARRTRKLLEMFAKFLVGVCSVKKCKCYL